MSVNGPPLASSYRAEYRGSWSTVCPPPSSLVEARNVSDVTSDQPPATPPLVAAEVVPAFAAPQADVWFHLVLLLLSSGVLILAAILRVQDSEQVVVPWIEVSVPGSCSYRLLLGIPCPGCGLTRCFVSLAHGDLLKAWQYNAVGVFFFVLVVLQIPFRLGQLWRVQHGLPEWQFGYWDTLPLGLLIVLLLIQWLWRTGLV